MRQLRIGITGATGFLGSFLLPRLAARDGVDVVALTRTIGPTTPVEMRNVEWRQGDLTSARDTIAFVADLNAVIHLAHTNTPLTSSADIRSDAIANVIPALTLIDSVRSAGTRTHVVFPSSGGALYRPSIDGRPVDEESPLEPLTSYGILKLTFEHYLRLAVHEGSATATVLRIGNPYGVLLPPERLQGFIGVAVQQLLEGRPIRVFGDLGNVRDYIYLDDLDRLFAHVLTPSRDFAVYNVGTGRGASVREILGILEHVTGRKVTIEHSSPTGDEGRLPPWVVLDSSKAERELGWRAEVGLEEGIAEMWREAQTTWR